VPGIEASRRYCDVIVVTCIDFRFQPVLSEWLNETLEPGSYDRVALAGGVKNWPVVMAQIEIARRLHNVRRVVLVNHEDCGAYGAEGTHERHITDLRAARDQVRAAYPSVDVDLYFARLDGSIEAIDE
jgi:carbonic anhydrase